MAIVSNITKQVDIPHEDGEWMKFRRLSWRQLEEASEAQMKDSLERMKELGGDMVKALREFGQEQQGQESQQYDQAAILCAGIVDWSYGEEVCEENIDLLDKQTAEWAYHEILSMNFRSKEETKND